MPDLSPDAPAAAVEAGEEDGEAERAEGEQSDSVSETAEEKVAHAEEHRVDQREAENPMGEVVAQSGVVGWVCNWGGGCRARSRSLRFAAG